MDERTFLPTFDFKGPVLLDTNTMLNAVHNPAGLAAFAVRCIIDKKLPLLVPTYARDESIRLDTKILKAAPLAWSKAWLAVDRFMEENDLQLVATRDTTPVLGINSADEPIARVSRDLGATLITDDADLVSECRKAGLRAVQSWAVARSFEGDGQLVGMNSIARFRPWDATGGYIFARAMAGGWAQIDHPSDSPIAEMGPIKIGYRGKKHAWFLDYKGERSILIPQPIEDMKPYLVAASVTRLKASTKVKLSVASVPGSGYSQTSEFGRFDNLSLETLHLGGKGQHEAWNGMFQDFVCGPGGIGKTFRTYSKHYDLSPNPYDDNALRANLIKNKFNLNINVNRRGNIIP